MSARPAVESSDPDDGAKGRVETVVRSASPGINLLARLGYAAKGLIFAVIGALALLASIGAGGRFTNQLGAIKTLANQPAGRALILVLGIGLAGHGLWRLVQAGYDPACEGKFRRIAHIAAAIGYSLLALAAFTVFQGLGIDEDGSRWLRWVTNLPLGRYVVLLTGLVLIGLGIGGILNACRGRVGKALDTDNMDRSTEKTASVTGRMGLSAMGLILFLLGAIFTASAVTSDYRGVGGFERALRLIANAPLGPVFLAAAAIGLLAYGVFLCIQALYRKMPEP